MMIGPIKIIFLVTFGTRIANSKYRRIFQYRSLTQAEGCNFFNFLCIGRIILSILSETLEQKYWIQYKILNENIKNLIQ